MYPQDDVASKRDLRPAAVCKQNVSQEPAVQFITQTFRFQRHGLDYTEEFSRCDTKHIILSIKL